MNLFDSSDTRMHEPEGPELPAVKFLERVNPILSAHPSWQARKGLLRMATLPAKILQPFPFSWIDPAISTFRRGKLAGAFVNNLNCRIL